ncbi:MAG: S24/S26 family peptidase [Lachnospiraceae bacterium]|nr:S24/S26 family peptidase [Lachnospiraceae bacterium]
MEKQKADIEQLLAEGQVIQLKPRGTSMYPMFVEGRDEAVIAPLKKIIQADGSLRLRRGDVVLYRREDGILVLHRICRCAREGYYLVGDHQSVEEGPIRDDQIRGILTGFIRRGNYCSVRHPVYLLAVRIWLILLPVRPKITRALYRIKRSISEEK